MTLSDMAARIILAIPLDPIINDLKSNYHYSQEKTDSSIYTESAFLHSNRIAIKKFLFALTTHPIADYLKVNPKISLEDWIISILEPLSPNDLDLPIFKVLAISVAESNSDEATWKGMPQKVFMPYGLKKWLNSNRSFHQEVAKSTYVKVGGFWKKYFCQGEWMEQSSIKFKRLSIENHGDPLCDFPKELSEETLWMWLDSFQQRYLDQTHGSPVGSRKTESTSSSEKRNQASRGKYFRMTRIGDIPGKQCHRQLDVFTKSRSCPAERPHHWRDVQVVGILTNSTTCENWQNMFLQLACYMREVFYAQPLRRFAHAFLLYGTQLRLWVFDPCGAFGSGMIDIKDEPEHFIRAITAYTLMNDDELGIDLFMDSDNQQITVKSNQSTENQVFQLDMTPVMKKRLKLWSGTTCYRTTDGEYIAKFSWTESDRPSEIDLHHQARNVAGVAKLIGSQNIISTDEIRSGLDFLASDTEVYESVASNKSNNDNDESLDDKEIEKRRELDLTSFPKLSSMTLSCHCVSPVGRPLRSFKSVKELITAMRDITRAHRQLLQEAKILYCDIHESNMRIIDPLLNNGISGTLINLSQAIPLEDPKYENLRASNAPFTSPDLLNKKNKSIKQTFRHDLESLFYVLLSIFLKYGWEDQEPSYKCPIFQNETGKHPDWKHVKDSSLSRFRDRIVRDFLPDFSCVEKLAINLKHAFYTADKHRPSSTPSDPDILYGPILEAYEEALLGLDE
ncbi:serine/threonine protein kinase Sgk2 [Blumeria hordei DH14]|uniref:Serine/threonine protein kinase Sgk2 n=1 Tax=Blumeria graminis f. sp. hordei (strain DH14) TaxID=546991 RepID=N1JIV7_BLUG1|nr:serine/threonine protein kinase Sgk2 [Blumeria hordei DH14]